MSEQRPPPRLLDDPSAAPSMRAALRGALRDRPTDAQHLAIGAALAKTLADLPPPAPAGGGGGGAGGAPAAAGGASAKALAIGGLATAALVGAAVVGLRSSPPPPPPAAPSSNTTVTAPAVPTSATAAPVVEPVFDVSSLPSAPPAPSVVRPTASVAPIPTTAPPEMTLLREAQENVGSSPATTLARCDEHARAYPKGSMAQEREVLAIDALLRLGRRAEAEQRAARFEATYPGSAYSRRITSLLAR
jgi:hypothetical protein